MKVAIRTLTAGVLVLPGCSTKEPPDHLDAKQLADQRPSGNAPLCDWASSAGDMAALPVSKQDAERIASVVSGAPAIVLRRSRGNGCVLEANTTGASTYYFEEFSRPSEVSLPSSESASIVLGKFVLTGDLLSDFEPDVEFIVREIYVGTHANSPYRVCCSMMSAHMKSPLPKCDHKLFMLVQDAKDPSESRHYYLETLRGRTLGTSSAPVVEIPGGYWNGQYVSGFLMDASEVSVGEYQQCVRASACAALPPTSPKDCNMLHPSRFDHPVNCVNWCDAAAYCDWVGKRLPTSREWQWAARGREDGRKYPWGDEAPTCARAVMLERKGKHNVLVGCGEHGTAPVGSRPSGASRDGVLDMAGNVAEWVASGDGEYRGLYGGDWYTEPANVHLRVEDGGQRLLFDTSSNNGFRCIYQDPARE